MSAKRLTFKQKVFEFLNQHVELQQEKTVVIINKFREMYPTTTTHADQLIRHSPATSTLYQFIKDFKRISKDTRDDEIIVI